MAERDDLLNILSAVHTLALNVEKKTQTLKDTFKAESWHSEYVPTAYEKKVNTFEMQIKDSHMALEEAIRINEKRTQLAIELEKASYEMAADLLEVRVSF
ncbi:hypothetical protein BDF14DRAFT_1885828 [Spinellus fusiger]|nr:hypothetical protein BDF14DRAFT_1885828 [Spinellus fusiger]